MIIVVLSLLKTILCFCLPLFLTPPLHLCLLFDPSSRCVLSVSVSLSSRELARGVAPAFSDAEYDHCQQYKTQI